MSRRIFALGVRGRSAGVYSVKTLVHQALSNLYPDITDLRIFNKKKKELVPATYNAVCSHLTKNENGDAFSKCFMYSNKEVINSGIDLKNATEEKGGVTDGVVKIGCVAAIFEQEINVDNNGVKYNGSIADMDPKWLAPSSEWIGEVEPAKVEEKEEAADEKADEEVDEEEVKTSEPVKEVPSDVVPSDVVPSDVAPVGVAPVGVVSIPESSVGIVVTSTQTEDSISIKDSVFVGAVLPTVDSSYTYR